MKFVNNNSCHPVLNKLYKTISLNLISYFKIAVTQNRNEDLHETQRGKGDLGKRWKDDVGKDLWKECKKLEK